MKIPLDQYYTIPCRAFNPTSQYQKQIKLYDKKGKKFLPNFWVYEYDMGNIQTRYQDIHFISPQYLYNSQLSDEQKKIMERVEARVSKYGYTSGIINMKTGRGKTHIISEIINRLPGRALILCHNEVNCRSTKAHFQKFYQWMLDKIGFAFSWVRELDREILISTHKTFALHPEYFQDREIILYDEMHKNISDAMIRSLCAMKNCRGLYGFSGTPYRDDLHKADLERIFWKEIAVEGYMLPSERYNMLPTLYVEEYITPKYDYIDYHELRSCAMEDTVRTTKQMETLVKYLEKFNRTCSLVFTDRVSEAETYAKKLRENPSLSVVLIHGNTDVAEATKALAIARVMTKPIVIVWTIQKIGTGTDIPYIDAVFFFSPTKFNWTVVQGIGRWLRLSAGKKDIILVDWHDNDKWILHRQHLERIKICKSEYGAVVNKIDG